MAFQAKRKFRRSHFREGVRLVTPAGVEYATFEDISAGGLKLFLTHTLQSGTLLDVEFSIRVNGKSNEIAVKARVVHCFQKTNGYEVGIQFIDLSSENQKQLHSLIDSEDGPF